VTSTTAVQQRREPIGKTHRQCPICDSSHLEYEFVVDKSPVCGCQACGLLFLNPQPGISSAKPFISPPEPDNLTGVYEANARERVARLVAYSGVHSGKLLLVGADAHLEAEFKKQNFEVVHYLVDAFESALGVELSGAFDACVFFCALERMRNPLAVLRGVRGVLKQNGALMVVSPTTDSRTARLFRSSWWEFNRMNLFYFSVDTLQNLLIRAGFGDPMIAPDRNLVSLNYLQRRLQANPSALRHYRLLRGITSFSPVLRDRAFRLFYGRTQFLVRAKTIHPKPLLSVIVAVYNERATFVELIERLLAKSIENIDIEVIIVESNSTDGTRDYVLRYKNNPQVRLILEEKPMGKGHAVRMGLKAAKGDIVLFQDADLEYDINDYDALVAPLLRFQTNFVLGSRHSAGKDSWKIRHFSDSPGLSVFFNFGHILFLTLFNLLYSQRLGDPFTMYKVFRRECLFGLTFECNRFDFDFEVVIKLLRKGYKPLELPVNYKSRSIKEGKKVSTFRDPLTWLRALIKFRNSPLYSNRQPGEVGGGTE